MQISQANLDALRVQFQMGFEQAYSETPIWHPQLTTTAPSGAKQNTYGWIAKQTRMREWIGPREALNLSEHEYTLANLPFEATIELDRDDIEDDNLGLFMSVTIPELAQAAAKHPDQLIKTMLQSNAGLGPTAFDGQLLFSDSHPTFAKPGAVAAGAATTYDNLFDLALTQDNFNTVWASMASYTGEDGEPLGVMPDTLVIPPQLRLVATEILEADVIAKAVSSGGAGASNVTKGWAKMLIVPELANAPTQWYLADTSKPMKPLILQNRRADQFVSRDSPQDPKVFDLRKFTYGVDNRRNVGVSLPFLIATSVPGT